MRFTARRPSLFAVLVVAGCSSSESSPGAPSTGPAPIALPSVKVDVALSAYANGGAERIVDGYFATGRQTGISCTTETIEQCAISTCTQVDNATPGTVVDPGAVKVSSASMGADLPLTLDAKTGYGRIVQSGDFADAEEVRVVGAGGATVAAFDLKVKIPAALEAKTIGSCGVAASSTASCALPESAPVVTWSGGGKTVFVSLAPTLDLSSYTTLRCAFAGAAGSGQIPAAALAKLQKTTGYRVSVASAEDPATTASGVTPSVGLAGQRRSKTTLASVSLP